MCYGLGPGQRRAAAGLLMARHMCSVLAHTLERLNSESECAPSPTPKLRACPPPKAHKPMPSPSPTPPQAGTTCLCPVGLFSVRGQCSPCLPTLASTRWLIRRCAVVVGGLRRGVLFMEDGLVRLRRRTWEVDRLEVWLCHERWSKDQATSPG